METLPIITTPRLTLREIQDYDYLDMYEYARIPFVGQNAGWQSHASPSETKQVIKLFQGKKKYGQLGVFAIVWNEDGKMVGTVELHTYVPRHKAELGYTVNPDYWGRGIALEASKYVLAWGFEDLNLKRIECTAFTDNHRSRRVCEKLGLRYEGMKKKGYMLYDGSIHDIDCFGITDDEYNDRILSETWW
jgi:RimJ/RimL family protein N-acetyltransferase